NAQQWRNFANEVADNSGISRAPENIDPTYPSLNTNWQDLFYQNAPAYNFNLGVSGGGENASYYANMAYYNQNGITIYNSFKRFNTRFNIKYYKNKLTISENLGISYRNERPPAPGISSIPLPTLPAFDEEGNIVSGGPKYYLKRS